MRCIKKILTLPPPKKKKIITEKFKVNQSFALNVILYYSMQIKLNLVSKENWKWQNLFVGGMESRWKRWELLLKRKDSPPNSPEVICEASVRLLIRSFTFFSFFLSIFSFFVAKSSLSSSVFPCNPFYELFLINFHCLSFSKHSCLSCNLLFSIVGLIFFFLRKDRNYTKT